MMKRILFITPFVPGKTEGGGAAYTFELLGELSRMNIVDLVYFRYKDKNNYLPDNCNVNVIKEYVVTKKSKIISILSCPFFFPLFTARFRWAILNNLKRIIKENSYDFIYFDFGQTFSYAKYLNHPKKILMAHDVIAQKYSRMKKWLYSWAVRSERNMLKSGNYIFTFSQKDCDLIDKLYGLNSKPTTFFLSEDVRQAYPNAIGDYYVMFGSWGREENYIMLEWLLKNEDILIRNNRRVMVVGGGNIPANIKDEINKSSKITYVGYVENPYPIISNAIAEIAPLSKGAGVKVKCVEALACGTPIIGTEVAFEGIPSEFNEFMIEANSIEEYASAMNKVDFSLAKRIYFKNNFCRQYDNKTIFNLINKDEYKQESSLG